jgi:phytoene dehydrogenase-like protein
MVLEQAIQTGGATHGFAEAGFEFEMGLQDVGAEIWKGMDAKEPFAHVMTAATMDGVEWNQLKDVSYKIFIGEEELLVKSSWKEFRADLICKFPKEEAAIDKFYDLVTETRNNAVGFVFSKLPLVTQPGGIAHRFTESLKLGGSKDAHGAAGAKEFNRIALRTVDEVLDDITNDMLLRYCLTFLWAKCGLPPKVASWGAFSLVVGQYFDGIAYPTGGSISIEKCMVDVIEKNGGVVFVDAQVEEIACEKGACVGITLAGGKIVRADKVVSAIGAANTFERLIPQSMTEYVRAPLLALKDLKWSSYAILQIFFGFEGDAQSLGLSSASHWFLPSEPDHTENAVKYFLDSSFGVDFPYIHVSFPSAKDPSNPKSTAVLFAAAHYDWFKGMTPEDVQAVADEIVARLSAKLYAKFPQLKSKVKFVELATPLAHEFHLGANRGAPLGLGHSPSRYEQEWLRPQTAIKNLVLAGQDVLACGVVNASVGGFMGAVTAFPQPVLTKFRRLF